MKKEQGETVLECQEAPLSRKPGAPQPRVKVSRVRDGEVKEGKASEANCRQQNETQTTRQACGDKSQSLPSQSREH